MSEVKVNVSLRSAVATGLAEIKGQFKSFEKSISSSFGGALVGAVGLGALVSGAKGVVDYGAKVQDLSDQLGVSTDAIQHFGNVAEKNGSSLEAMAMGFKKLEVARSKALQGGQEQIAAFKNLGISIVDLQSLNPEELMTKLGASSLNAADTVKLLGKNALELRPTLAGIADGTVKIGGSIDAINIKKLKEASDEWKTMFQVITIEGGKALGWLLSTMDKVGEKVFQMLSDEGDFDEVAAAKADAMRRAKYRRRRGLTEAQQAPAAAPEARKRDFSQEEGDGTSGKKDERSADRIATLRASLTELQRKASNEQLGTEEKINALIGQRAALLKESGGEKDEEKKLSLLIDAQRISDEITRAQEHRSGPPKVIADSLARIGGGGRVSASGAGDAHLHEAKLHTSYLKQLVDLAKNPSPNGQLALQE
jgi:hypothetical protein